MSEPTTGSAPEKPVPNTRGEVPGLGAEWSCAQFDQPGHNYIICPDCLDNFEQWWNRDGKKRGTR